MSANKTIKALREERIKHLTEIARLRALAGEQTPHRDAVRDARLGILPFKSPAEVAAMIEQSLERQYLGEVRGGGKCQDVPYFDWRDAPEDATHALADAPVLWLRLREGETARFWKTSLLGSDPVWHDLGQDPHWYINSGKVIARPVPEEVWSLDGANGSWDYSDLATLVREHYGHVCDSDGPMGSGSGTLAVGSIVYRATVCKDDPANFLQDAGEVQEWMQERAWDSDAGEWADNYPEVGDEAKAALEKALEPLKRWARVHCQPNFFTVKDITTHELTDDDIHAAGMSPQVWE